MTTALPIRQQSLAGANDLADQRKAGAWPVIRNQLYGKGMSHRASLAPPLFMERSVAPVASIPTLPEAPDGQSRLTVLFGDDHETPEPWHQQAIGLLGSQGVETVVARSGRDALERLEEAATGGRRIHVAVLEQAMCDMSGLQVLRRLRERITRQEAAEASIPPAILLAQPSARDGGLNTGLMHDALLVSVFSVLPKPIDTNQLLDTLARALRRHYRGQWPGGSSEASS
jgi:CheY-like chemotaxis protein